MSRGKFVAVRCRISKGLFTTERAFTITLANGEKHSGPAALDFLWNLKGERLGRGDALGGEVEGLVAARELLGAEVPAGMIAVEVPDGEAIAVKAADVTKAPTEITPKAVSA